MRRCAVAVCLLALTLTAPAGAAGTHEAIVNGHIRTVESGRLELTAEVSGTLDGTLTLDLGVGSSHVVGTPWTLSVRAQDDAGEWHEAGQIHGVLLHGSFHASPDGTLMASEQLELSISEGSGDFESLSSGSGQLSLEVTLTELRPASGRLVLSF
jgi:hypothetical protein